MKRSMQSPPRSLEACSEDDCNSGGSGSSSSCSSNGKVLLAFLLLTLNLHTAECFSVLPGRVAAVPSLTAVEGFRGGPFSSSLGSSGFSSSSSSSSSRSEFAVAPSAWVGGMRGGGRRSPLPLQASSSDLEATLGGGNAAILSDEEKGCVSMLLSLDQDALFENWPAAGEKDEAKHGLLEQLQACDANYPGGLEAYITKARALLKESAEGVNPFDGYTPEVPDGTRLNFGTAEFEKLEQKGMEEVGKMGFVLVAGGLGERLGFNGIKLALPVEVSTGQSYLELYVKHILALQDKCRTTTGDSTLVIPLILMTSGDTDEQTRALLKERNNFGMADEQIIVVVQDKVPALGDSSAALVTDEDDPFELQTKPHGHGDVHHLLHRDGVVERLLKEGKEWLFFFQDTNAPTLNCILPVLGVSVTQDYDMNSICVPRSAGEAAGAITALKHDDGSSLIINVEYNQLDALLRDTVNPEGDVNDPATGYSPYPGNINTIIMKLQSYNKVLQGPDEGVVVEFVNPKYTDATKTKFKKPTRLECMMQDLPKLMVKELDSPKIGFTSLEKWLSFSPAKNSLESAAESAAAGVPPGTTSSAEADFYTMTSEKLKKVTSAELGEPQEVTFEGVTFQSGPRVILSPSFATSTADLKDKIGKGVKISSSSTVIVDGKDVTLEDVDVDGALSITVTEGASVTVKGLKCRNKGWAFKELPEDRTGLPEEDRVRGYTMDKRETLEVSISEPGHYVVSGEDGAVVCSKSES